AGRAAAAAGERAPRRGLRRQADLVGAAAGRRGGSRDDRLSSARDERAVEANACKPASTATPTPFQGGAALSVPLHPSSGRPARAGAPASLRLDGQPDEVIYAPLELHVRQLVSEPPGDLVLILERTCSSCRGAAFVPVTEARPW